MKTDRSHCNCRTTCQTCSRLNPPLITIYSTIHWILKGHWIFHWAESHVWPVSEELHPPWGEYSTELHLPGQLNTIWEICCKGWISYWFLPLEWLQVPLSLDWETISIPYSSMIWSICLTSSVSFAAFLKHATLTTIAGGAGAPQAQQMLFPRWLESRLVGRERVQVW